MLYKMILMEGFLHFAETNTFEKLINIVNLGLRDVERNCVAAATGVKHQGIDLIFPLLWLSAVI